MKRTGLPLLLALIMLLGVAITASAPSAGAAPVISPPTLATDVGRVGQSYQASLSFTAGATWSVVSGHVPAGLTLQSGQVSGVPTAAGSFTFIVRATDSSSTATKTYTILVYPPASTGFEARAAQMVFNRATAPVASAGACNHTTYLTYATATLWQNENVADANSKLASLKITQIGNPPPSCDPRTDESRNNLQLAYLIRPYMLYNSTSSYFPGRMTAAAANNLVAQMWSYASRYSKLHEAPNTWSLYDSENHDAQAESFSYLAAQIFSHRADYRNRKYLDGSTVAQQLKAWHDHWSHYFDERAKRGLFVEVGSPTYHGYTLQAILNIYNFADDPILRQKAGMILDLDFADFAQQELHNISGGAKSRSYPDDSYTGATDTMTNFANLEFGSSTPIDGDNHILMLATSAYSPPPVVRALVADRAGMGSFAYVSRRPGVGPIGYDPHRDWNVDPSRSILDYAYVTPDYVMGTAELRPSETHVAPSSQNRWQGIIFDTTPDARVYPQAAPSGVSPTNDAFASVQNKNVLITGKVAYTTEPTLVYFAASLDSLVETQGWLFVREGSAYLAVRPAAGTYHWLTHAKNKAAQRNSRFISLTSPRSPIIFEAARASSYSSFGAFQSRIVRNARTFKSGVLNYTASGGTKVTFSDDGTTVPKLNGHPLSYSPADVFNSPFITSVWGSGKVTLRRGAQSATYNFSNAGHPVKVVH